MTEQNSETSDVSDVAVRIDDLPVELDRDIFLRSLLGELMGAFEDVVGIDESSVGKISSSTR